MEGMKILAGNGKRVSLPPGHFCHGCETWRPLTSFNKNPLVGNGRSKYLPYCKTCCLKRLKMYTRYTGSQEGALWVLLAEMGIPFIKRIWERTYKFVEGYGKAGRKPDIFLTYLDYMNQDAMEITGLWQSDVMLTAFMKKPDIMEKKKDEEEEEDPYVSMKLDLNEQKLIWGEYRADNGKLDMNAYEFLNRNFESYTHDIPEMDTNLINRYRDLCKAEWRLRKANESGDGNEISKAQDALTKQLTLLKLNDFTSSRKTDTEKMIERKIWIIENTKPAECEDLEIYKDFSGFQKPFEEIKRCLQNLCAGTREYPKIPKSVDR